MCEIGAITALALSKADVLNVSQAYFLLSLDANQGSHQPLPISPRWQLFPNYLLLLDGTTLPWSLIQKVAWCNHDTVSPFRRPL